MGLSAITYALSKKFAQKYVEETAAQFGALKGANCTIQSIVKENGQSIITFQWKNDNDEIRTSTLYVDDGTNIYVWTSGYTYNYGDIALYGDAFYRCIYTNSDIEFDSLKWNPIGSPDGDYDIVQAARFLPQRFTAADRKMYYCIEEDHFYFWNGFEWVPKTTTMVDGESIQVDEDGKLSIKTDTIVDGESIQVDEDGKLSVSTVSDDDIDKLFE